MELSKSVSLKQAIYWVALDIEPMTKKYEELHNIPDYQLSDYQLSKPHNIRDPKKIENIQKAKRQLHYLLKESKLKATGIPTANNGTYYNDYEDEYRASELNHNLPDHFIRYDFWSEGTIDWDTSSLTLDLDNIFLLPDELEGYEQNQWFMYVNITIDRTELMKAFPKEETSNDDNSPAYFNSEYKTEFMELMERAIKHFTPEVISNMKKPELKTWLMNNSKEFAGKQHAKGLSAGNAESMAAFLRPLEKTKGGNVKT